MGSDSAAVDAALREADAVVKKLEFQFGMNIAESGRRAVAGVLYQQAHGGTFPAVQRLFRVNGRDTFTKPTFNGYRERMADLDQPDAFIARLEKEEQRRHANATREAARRAAPCGSARPSRTAPSAAKPRPASQPQPQPQPQPVPVPVPVPLYLHRRRSRAHLHLQSLLACLHSRLLLWTNSICCCRNRQSSLFCRHVHPNRRPRPRRHRHRRRHLRRSQSSFSAAEKQLPQSRRRLQSQTHLSCQRTRAST